MFKYSAFAVVLLTVYAAAFPSNKGGLSQLLGKAIPEDDCITTHCKQQAASCSMDANCKAALACIGGCVANWNNDPSPQNFKGQNCTNICASTYGSDPAFQAIFTCAAENMCIKLPPIPKTCKAPNVKPIKPLSTKDLEGKWWVQRGYHKVYDCYPCQTMTFSPLNQTSWRYHPVFDAYTVNNSLVLVTSENYIMPNTQPGEEIKYTYKELGLIPLSDTWWVLDKAEDNSWIINYYCGSLLEWNYEGATVLSKEKVLTPSAYMQIAESYRKAVGLELQEFCRVDNEGSQCTQ